MEAAGAEDHHHHEQEQTREEEAGRKTVVALDHSEHSFHALQWALQTINFGPSDQLFLLHAKSSPTSSAAFGGPATYPPPFLLLATHSIPIMHKHFWTNSCTDSHIFTYFNVMSFSVKEAPQTPNRTLLGYILSTEMIVSMERSQEREINAFMSKALELCQEKQVHAEKYVVFGDPRDVICEAVEKVHADILVIGSHGYGAVKRAVLGSVSDYCAHHVKCPVVIVKKSHKKGDREKH